jgi:hypothetical protein
VVVYTCNPSTLRQEDHEFKSSLGYGVCSRPAYVTYQDSISKNKKKKKKKKMLVSVEEYEKIGTSYITSGKIL